jgi:hypothetical protein
MFAAASEALRKGGAVVLDSPVFSPRTLVSGQQVADDFGADYCFLELYLEDRAERAARLAAPERLPCQARSLAQCKRGAITYRPSSAAMLLNSGGSLAELTESAMGLLLGKRVLE